MMRAVTSLLVSALFALATTQASAELSAGQKLAVEALIAQFAAKEFAVRQAAVTRLIEIGPDVVPLVKKTLAETTDAEVRLRCEMVIKSFTAPKRLIERAVKDPAPATPVTRIRWTVSPENKVRVSVNGVEGREYDSPGKYPEYVVSPDRRRYLQAARVGDRCFVVSDGVEGPAYGAIGWMLFSPDSRRYAYTALRAGEWFVVCDGKQFPSCGKFEPERAQFTPDGRHVYWLNQVPNSRALVVDGAQGAWRHGLFLLRTAAGERLSYLVQEHDEKTGSKAFVLEAEWPAAGQAKLVEAVRRALPVNGDMQLKPIVPWPRGGLGNWTYPRAERGEAEVRATVGSFSWGEPPNARTVDGEIYFSPFGPEPACAVVNYRYKDYTNWVLFRNREFGPYDWDVPDEHWRFTFSPDGEHLAFLAPRRHKWIAVLDGVEGPAWDDIEDLIVSPDWKHVAYRAKRGDAWLFVVDGLVSERHASVRDIAFSPDSRHVAYVASSDGRKFVVCDGVEGPPHQMVAMGVDPRDGASDRLRYSVCDRDGWTRVEVEWPVALDRTNGLDPPEP
jgi:hypothetical protein